MADDFSISAIISAQYSQFTDAMAQLGSAAQSGMDRVREAFGGANTASEQMTRLAESSREASASIGEQFAELRESAMHLAEAFGALEAARWAKEQIASALEAGEQLTRMSQITGISIGQLQQLQFAATATGGSLESLSMFAQQVQRAVVSIQSGQGNRYGSVLQAAGIDPNSIHSAQDALTALSGAVQHFGAQSEQVRNLLVTMGGRGGLALEPMLSKLPELNAEFDKLHIAMSAGDVATLNEANEQVSILGAAMEALRNKVVAGLAAPSIEAATQLITDFIGKLNQAGDSGKMRQWGLETLDVLGQVSHAAVNFGAALGDAASDAKTIYDDLQSVATELNKINDAAGRFGDKLHDYAVEGVHKFESGVLSAYSGKNIQIGGAPNTLGAGNMSVVGGGAGAVGSWADAANAKIDEVIAAEKKELEQRQQMTGAAPGGATGNAAAAAGNAASAGKDNRSQVLSQFSAMEHARAEIAGGTAAQIQAADQAVYTRAVQLFGAQSEQAVRAYATMAEAARRASTEKIAAAQKELSEEQRKLTQLKSLDAQELTDRANNQIKILQLVQQAHQGDVSVAQQTAAQINQIHQQLYSQLESLYAGDAAKYERYEQLKISSSLTAARQILQAQETANKQYEADVNSTASFVSGKFNTMIEGAVRGTLNLQEIAQQTFLGVIQSAVEMIVQKLIAMAAQTTLVTGAMALLQSIMGGGNAVTGMAQQKIAAAQLAGANMVATASLAPWPLDLLAPAEGAAAFAAAASMAGGGLIDSIPRASGGGVPIIAHPHEMVLPANISDHILSSMSAPAQAGRMNYTPNVAPDNASGARGFSGGGDTHHHYNATVNHTVNAVDAASFHDMIDQHKEAIAGAVHDAFTRLGAGHRYSRVG